MVCAQVPEVYIYCCMYAPSPHLDLLVFTGLAFCISLIAGERIVLHACHHLLVVIHIVSLFVTSSPVSVSVQTKLLWRQGLQLPYLRSWVPNSEEEAYLLQCRSRAQALPIEVAAPPISALDPVTQASIAINDFLREGADSENPQLGSEQLEGHDLNVIGRRIADELTSDGASDLADREHSGFVTPGPDNDDTDNADDDTLSARGPRPNLDFTSCSEPISKR
ncbi:hypothetical protein BC835DRAFT_1424139 [Cytidiella melzeri]|nr:hypothetical protein BC835DRAFT_1424139 [Cytidiella melzeri]